MKSLNLSSFGPGRHALALRHIVVTLAWLLCVPAVLAQQAQVVHEGPHYVGEPFLIQVAAEGFEEDPTPTCEPGTLPEGLTLTFASATPNKSSFTQIINGRRTGYTRIVWVFNFHATANNPATYSLPPFVVNQRKRHVSTRGLKLNVQDIETDPNMRVALILPSEPVYPGQRVPITIEWSYAEEFDGVQNLRVRSLLFDHFTFIDEPVSREDNVLPIWTEQGQLSLKATGTKRTLDGREYIVLVANRFMLIDRPGEIDLDPITANITKVTRWRQDIFGQRRAVATTRVRAIGHPQKLVILPLPLDQAPASYAGAVGRGFTIDVNADRSVVRVGDPITLALTLRGEGYLERIGLPSFGTDAGNTDGGLDPKQFRLPDGDVAGTLLADSNGKQFVITVRVLDESVTQIPPLAYSWFDPKERTFQTAHSDPIALQVLPTQVVSAQDVVSGQPKPDGAVEKVDAAVSSKSMAGLDLTGADLAIVQNPARLLVDASQRLGGNVVRGLIYAGSVLLIVLAWLRQRAAAIDPEVIRRRKVMKEQIGRISRAVKLPRLEAAAQISAALRQIAANGIGQDQRSGFDDLLEECDVLTYAPDADDTKPIDSDLHDRAVRLTHSIMKEGT